MAYQQSVIEVKERLKNSSQHFEEQIPLYDAIVKLTEPRLVSEESKDKAYYLSDYEAMWKSLEKHSDPVDIEGGNWVLFFVRAVVKASQLPPYYSSSKKDNKEVMNDISKLSASLAKLYQKNGLDAQIVLNNKNLLAVKAKDKAPGLYVYEDLYEIEKGMAGSSEFLDERKQEEFVLFSKILEVFADRAEEKISEVLSQRGNMSANADAIRFVRNLSRSVRINHNAPLNEAVAVATYALYGVYYGAVNIVNILNR